MDIQNSILTGAIKSSVMTGSGGGTPSIVLGAAAGTGASITINGNNLCGDISLTTGIGVLAAGTVMTLTLADGFSFPNKAHVALKALNDGFRSVKMLLYYNLTANTITLLVSTNLPVSSTYTGSYLIFGR